MSRDLVRINPGCGLATLPGFYIIDNSPSVVLARFPSVKWALYKTGPIGSEPCRSPTGPISTDRAADHGR